MTNQLNIGVVGALGAVGQEIIRLLIERSFPINHLKCFGSKRSAGKFISFQSVQVPIEKLSASSFDGLDVLFFAAGSAVSKEYVEIAQIKGILVIDSSSAFRDDPTIPLVIPEVNHDLLQKKPSIIASPNCIVTLLLTVLFPLHATSKIKRMVLSTYQSASGAGNQAMKELQEETLFCIHEKPYTRSVMPHPYAFNLFLHNSPIESNDHSQEEMKVIRETRKILRDETIQIAVTCVRVPVIRAHSISVNVEFHESMNKETAYRILGKAPGVALLDNPSENRFAMPVNASGKNSVFYSRIREDLFQPNTLDLWIVGDQLLKGAALNAVQILEQVQTARQPTASTV